MLRRVAPSCVNGIRSRTAALASTTTTTTAFNSKRYYAQYGIEARSHQELMQRYLSNFVPPTEEAKKNEGNEDFLMSILPQLERVEDMISQWRMNRWEFRVPVTPLTSAERERMKRQLSFVKAKILQNIARQKEMDADRTIVLEGLNLPNTPEVLAGMTRGLLQEKVDKLRYHGEVDKAKKIRESWQRLESHAARDDLLLERLCCMYNLARIGTFETAFGNLIVPQVAEDGETIIPVIPDRLETESIVGKRGAALSVGDPSQGTLSSGNLFAQLMHTMLRHIPSIHVMHDFMGLETTTSVHALNPSSTGYRDALKTYMTMSLRYKKILSQYGPQQLTSVDVGGGGGEAASNAASSNQISDREREWLHWGASTSAAGGSVFNSITPSTSSSRVLFESLQTESSEREILFDFQDSGAELADPNRGAAQGVVDFVYIRGTDITLITIASHNKYLRQIQLPHTKQIEGIARRASFVFGDEVSYDKVRVRNLLLPPGCLDTSSLNRLNRCVMSTNLVGGQQQDTHVIAVHPSLASWVPHYKRELGDAGLPGSVDDALDFAEMRKKYSADEWIML